MNPPKKIIDQLNQFFANFFRVMVVLRKALGGLGRSVLPKKRRRDGLRFLHDVSKDPLPNYGEILEFLFFTLEHIHVKQVLKEVSPPLIIYGLHMYGEK